MAQMLLINFWKRMDLSGGNACVKEKDKQIGSALFSKTNVVVLIKNIYEEVLK
jgi:hypothetical protein